ncbi:MAG TPA: hypothetical protein GX497_03730 [Bacillus bacterium]|nr:hypothetical protein [Bacillus sp. (in: firmicutes)]
MNLQWYLFDHSYLMGISYNPIDCLLTLDIDAKITYEHPKAKSINSSEDNFENISIRFEGVQYIRMINSLNLRTNPNDDFGSIEHLQLKSLNSVSEGFSIIDENDRKIMSLNLTEDNVVTIFTNSNSLSFLTFVSEMISFEIGFESYSIDITE